MFSQRLKEAMGEKGLKQVNLLHIASDQGVKLGKSQLSQYLSGKTMPRRDMLAFLASALGVTAAGLAYDVTGSYAAPIIAGIALVGIAGGCLAYLRWRVTTRPWEKRAQA